MTNSKIKTLTDCTKCNYAETFNDILYCRLKMKEENITTPSAVVTIVPDCSLFEKSRKVLESKYKG